MNKNNTKIIDELALWASDHRLVPFLGAGTSINHLSLDWDKITSDMAQEINVEVTGNLEIAQKYEDAVGKEIFCDFLKSKLLVNDYDEDKDIVPLIIISLGVGLIYTVNQDNVWEKCAQKYGRKYKKIVELQDLGNAIPGNTLFIKYHGDLNCPESIIFTKKSYDDRINNIDHPLNIRMRSDLLSKRFLFIGYSFRDPNIIKLFEELDAAFRGSLPPSYLVAYSYTKELETLKEKYGVTVIDPVREMDNSLDKGEAFELFLAELCKKTYELKTHKEIGNLFRPSTPSSARVVTKYEIAGVESKIKDADFKDSIAVFRAAFDISLIPDIYQERVENIFIELARRCSNRTESDELNGAAFNLSLNPVSTIMIVAAVTATAQVRGKSSGGIDPFVPIMKKLEEFRPMAVAFAIRLLKEWGRTIDDSFRIHVSGWIKGYNLLPSDTIKFIKQQIDFAWKSHTVLEPPIKYWKRLGHKDIFKLHTSFEENYKMISGRLPKQFIKPYEE